MRKYFALAAILLTATACGDTWGQRAVTGGAIGAGSGAVLGAATGFNPLLGAVVGGAARTGIGGDWIMSTIAKCITRAAILAAILFGATACGDTWGQRAVTGGGIGAGTGAVIG